MCTSFRSWHRGIRILGSFTETFFLLLKTCSSVSWFQQCKHGLLSSSSMALHGSLKYCLVWWCLDSSTCLSAHTLTFRDKLYDGVTFHDYLVIKLFKILIGHTREPISHAWYHTLCPFFSSSEVSYPFLSAWLVTYAHYCIPSSSS